MLEASRANWDTALSDAEIVARCVSGQIDAFEVLVSRHEPALRSRIRGFNLSPPLAEDAEQETWVRAFERLGSLRNGASFRPWLMRIASTTCLGMIRKDRRLDSLLYGAEVDLENVAAAGDGVTDPSADLSAVIGLLTGLPPRHSEVLIFRYLERLSLQEIVTQTGLSLSGVKARLRRARQTLVEAMGDMSAQSKEQAASELVERARRASQASHWEEAIETYEAAIRKADMDWFDLQELGRMCERRGDFPRAIKVLEQAVRLNPWPWLQVVMGWCYDGLGEREKAVDTYESVLRGGSAGPWAAAGALAGMKSPHPRRRFEPDPVEKERLVPRRGWTAKTNHNPDEAHLAIDGDLTTRWTSQAPQGPGMYFELDLGRTWRVMRVVLDDDGGGQCIWLGDCPHGYVIETSVDRATWQTVAEGNADFDQYACAALDGSPVRYIRTRLTDSFYPNWWSIYEIRVYAR